jgi:SAM-dependent methyltransferase
LGNVGKLITKLQMKIELYLSDILMCKFVESKSFTFLDVGCGRGTHVIKKISKGQRFVIGIDAYTPALKVARETGAYNEIIKSAVTHLPFESNKFDTVFLMSVIEHLKKEDGLKLIKQIETVAHRQVIIMCPLGYVPQEDLENNPWQIHRSGWFPVDFKFLGYEVHGFTGGLLLPYFVNLKFRSSPAKFLSLILWVSTLTLAPLYFLVPSVAPQLLCCKTKSV